MRNIRDDGYRKIPWSSLSKNETKESLNLTLHHERTNDQHPYKFAMNLIKQRPGSV